MTYSICFTSKAKTDAKKIKSSGLCDKVKVILETLASDPFTTPPPYEALVGNLVGAFSRRINIQRRIVYQVYQKEKLVKIIRMWTHYE